MAQHNLNFQVHHQDLLGSMDLLFLLKLLVTHVEDRHELFSHSLHKAQILIFPFLLALLQLLVLAFFSFLLWLCILVTLNFGYCLSYYLSLPLMTNLFSFFHHLFLKLLLLLLNFQILHFNPKLYQILLLVEELLVIFYFYFYLHHPYF